MSMNTKCLKLLYLEVICGRIFYIQFSGYFAGDQPGCLSVVEHIMLTKDEGLSQFKTPRTGHFDPWNGHGESLAGKVIRASASDAEAVRECALRN